MIQKYNLQSAVNKSYGNERTYFAGICGNYLVVIHSMNVSVWSRECKCLEFLFNVAHNYDLPNIYTESNRLIIKEAPIEFERYLNEKVDSFLENNDITDIMFDKIIDLQMPSTIITWGNSMSRCVRIYDKLDVLQEICGVDDIYPIKNDLHNSMFLNNNMEEAIKTADMIDWPYAIIIPKKINSIFIS